MLMPTPTKRVKQRSSVRVGVDTGGTFTDFVYEESGRLHIFKLASTPADPSRAILEGLERIALETGASLREIEVIHGTTVGTNALLQRRGARTALVTTAGLEDVLAIGRQARPSLYNWNVVRPAPLVDSELRFGVRERIGADGSIVEKLEERELTQLVKKIKRARVESVAVCTLFSFLNPAHERRIARALALLGVPLSVSHEILPEYREYERTSTIVVNAYLQPLMSAYLNRLSKRAAGLRVMQSSGGSISASVAAREPVRTILSGPAGGVIGALRAAEKAGASDIITFDMGGTSTDVALCAKGCVRMTNEALVNNSPIAVSSIDMQTVGAGGGSIARVDAGGGLRVGPESAGADPGPACYGQGLLPTVTDANLVLGRFGETQLLGGSFALDVERSNKALTSLAEEMSDASGVRVSAIDAALGVVRVVNIGMERALRAVSIERGFDPRSFTLVSFGGAGGLHAVELARALRVPRVLVPQRPGALSALGALASDVVRDMNRTVMLGVAKDDTAKLARVLREMKSDARDALGAEGFSNAAQRFETKVSLRYRGQSFELELEWEPKDNLTDAFHLAHEQRYGYALKENSVEIVSARVRGIGLVAKLRSETATPRRTKDKAMGNKASSRLAKPHGTSIVYFTKKPTPVAVYRREELPRGVRLRVPCVVTEYSSTTLVPPGARASLDAEGNLVIEP
ncbi:MAG: hydantoinase/oxoprolinase family protein [Pyrinomonadaceae bacterium]